MINDVFISDDSSVVKFIHEDGSETAVKVVKSCSNFIDERGHVSVEFVDRNKYSVFISHSTGCPVGCPFCHLTIKNSVYNKLTQKQVEQNIKDSILYETARTPSIKERFIKLCWMGMGDGFLDCSLVESVSKNIVSWIIENKLAAGIDSIDISTVLPITIKDFEKKVHPIISLNNWMNNLNISLNPQSYIKEQAEIATHKTYTNRSIVRVFYSLHSAKEDTRKKMVPLGMSSEEGKSVLHYLINNGVNVLFHQVFVEGLNDVEDEVDALIEFMSEFKEQELRILRYNFCDKSPYREWDKVIDMAGRLIDAGLNIKVQISAGKEVSAACGQFLVAITKERKKLGVL